MEKAHQPSLMPHEESDPESDYPDIEIYTKEQLIDALRKVRELGWIRNARPGNVGGVGNTLEDILGIEENNVPIPNAAEWELKCQRADTIALCTLFHMEPSPRAVQFVPRMLLPKYGWPHDEAGKKYPADEMSFRQTINAAGRSDRGFKVVVDEGERKIEVSFDAEAVDRSRHGEWLASVKRRVGLGELDPQPYWGFDDLYHKLGTKLHNCFFVEADRMREEGVEHFRYSKIGVLQDLSVEKFMAVLKEGDAYVDFDARTRHNHGTKFRIRRNRLPDLYERARWI